MYWKFFVPCCTVNQFLLPVIYRRLAANPQTLQFNQQQTLDTNCLTKSFRLSYLLSKQTQPQ